MDTRRAQKLFYENAAAVAYIEVQNGDGDIEIGTAFHIGEATFVTARHCVDSKSIREIKITEPIAISSREFMPGLPEERYDTWDAEIAKLLGHTPKYKHWLEPLELVGQPSLHPNPDVDLAIFKTAPLPVAVPYVKLGVHWDDWVYRRIWNLTSAVVLGYPPIPMSQEPILVAARGDIHTFVVPRHVCHIHFILSSTARGGFSGGPAIHEDGYALGLVTSSFVRDGLPSELGFQAVLSIEPIREFLQSLGLMPTCQEQYANELLGIKQSPPDNK
jgi:hypothetical protein